MAGVASQIASLVRHGLLHAILFVATIVGAVSGWFSRLLSATELVAGDNVVLFTTAARLTSDRQSWLVPLHGWVHQLERDDSIRRTLIACVVRLIRLDGDSLEAQFLRDRLGWFLVDNKRTRMVRLRLGEYEVVLGPTDPQGHFEGSIQLPREAVVTMQRDGLIDVEVVSVAHPARSFVGRVMLLGEFGTSVVSDMDDTVKVTHVLDRKELVRNTLLRAFQAVPGMAALYRQLAEQGVSFHFVSCSPWHLYPALEAFLRDAGFPSATILCRRLRIKDSSLHAFFSAPDEFKVPRILELLEQYPERSFLLVGDSGERDPEIYGRIARMCPERIRGILIRNVTQASPEDARWGEAFRGIEPTRWQLFSDPHEVEWSKWA